MSITEAHRTHVWKALSLKISVFKEKSAHHVFSFKRFLITSELLKKKKKMFNRERKLLLKSLSIISCLDLIC